MTNYNPLENQILQGGVDFTALKLPIQNLKNEPDKIYEAKHLNFQTSVKKRMRKTVNPIFNKNGTFEDSDTYSGASDSKLTHRSRTK